MKYAVQVEINQSLDKVIELFDNPDHLLIWMEELERYEHLMGTPGQPGAKAKLHFQMPDRKVLMTETVLSRDLPDSFTVAYEPSGVGYNVVVYRFEELGPFSTLYINEQSFEFEGIRKYFSFLMKGALKKQSLKYMYAFKRFVEEMMPDDSELV